MKKDFPEVEDFVRFSTPRIAYLNVDNKAHKEIGVSYADESLFNIFSFELISGEPESALKAPYSIVLSESTATRIFGTPDALGQIIKIGPKDVYKVTGIVKNPPSNSSIQFNTLISFASLYEDSRNYMDWRGGNQYITYVMLVEGTDPAHVEQKFPDFMWGYLNETISEYGWKVEPYLQPLEKIHFYYDKNSRASLTNFYTFSAIALFILVIACINFINLTTARAANRAREVGMRKVLGALRVNLIKQFLGESIVITFLSFLAGIVLVLVLTPIYNQLLHRDFSLSRMLNLEYLLVLVGLILVVGIVSGIYPAFYLSSFQPVKTLKGVFESSHRKRKLRNALVIFQFAISVTLIICTLLIQIQLNFMKKLELGFNKENIVVVPMPDRESRTKTEVMRTELMNITGIQAVSASSEVPYNGFTSNGYVPEGYEHSIMIHVVDVDYDFLNTFDIELVKGRNFSKEFPSDSKAYLINETLARQLSWDDPIGKIIRRNGDSNVIGVVKDFKFATLHNKIEPLLLNLSTMGGAFTSLSIKFKSSNIPETLKDIEKVYERFSPVIPFEYWFLDQAFDTLYKSEERFQKIFFYFSCLAIFIALLGLFSLSSYSLQQKSKEIGIRKVLGASIPNILTLFSKELILLIFAANAVAWPAAFYVINKWLGNFAYRENISLWIFLLAFVSSILAALLTIGFQILKAAFKNPVDELRCE
jgi:putative ABC transport system permease protein